VSSKASIKPEDVLELLKAGNRRFIQGNSVHPNIDVQRRVELSQGQAPFAVISTCSDSRVPPEIIFDRGLGDLFVVRVAGTIIDHTVMGSVVYGVSHLGCPLIVVLGHESCGAITKSLASDEEIQKEPSAILALIEKIRSNIPAALLQGSADSSVITAAIHENTKAVVKQIETEPSIAVLISDKKVRVVGGYYILRSGNIQLQ